MKRASLLFLASVLSGCSLLVHGADFLDDGGQHPHDGGMDSGPMPDGSQGDGGEHDANVPNRPPLASGVGLSDYSPYRGGRLDAFVGPTFDADGDPVSVRITWLVNGTAVSALTGPSIMLDPTRFSVGDTITVQVTTNDGEVDGNTVSATATLEDDSVTRWRMLLPPRDPGGATSAFFDPGRQRLLLHSILNGVDYGLWERQLTATGSGPWARIHPDGVGPAGGGGVVFWDDANRRLIVVFDRTDDPRGPGTLTSHAWSLKTTDDGRSSWTLLTSSGEPPARQFPQVAIDPIDHVAYVAGGMDITQSGLTDVWRFDFGTPGSERWTNLGASLPGPRVAGGLIVDRARNRLLMVGGGAPIPDGPPNPDNTIYALDLDNPSAGFAVVGTLPSPTIGSPMAVEGDHALFVLGLDVASPDLVARRALRLDLATLESTVTPFDDVGQGPIGIMTSRAPFASSYVAMTRGADRAGANAFEVDAAGTTWTPITVAGRDLPHPTSRANMAAADGSIVLSNGEMPAGVVSDAVAIAPQTWSIDPRGAMRLVADDPAPPARVGIVSDGSHPSNSGYVYRLFGSDDRGGLFDATVSRLRRDTWNTLARRAGATTPPGREGYLLYPAGCRDTRGNVIGIAFGQDASGNVLQDTWELECGGLEAETPSDCTWYESADTTAQAVVWGAAATDGARRVIAFGGQSATGMTNQVIWTDWCTGPGFMQPPWQMALVDSTTRPSPRIGHSLSAAGPATPGPTPVAAMYVFGGATTMGGPTGSNDVWRLTPMFDGTDLHVLWDQPSIAPGDTPAPRAFHAAVYDPSQQRLVIYGGRNDRRTLDDLWELRIR